TEKCDLMRFLWQCLVVEGPRSVRVQRQIELIFPTKFEPCPRQGVIPDLRGRVSLRDVRSMRRDLVGDDAGLDVVSVRKPDMLLGSDVAKHRRAIPGNHCSTDAAGDVVVA